jgi:hypothetical protein
MSEVWTDAVTWRVPGLLLLPAAAAAWWRVACRCCWRAWLRPVGGRAPPPPPALGRKHVRVRVVCAVDNTRWLVLARTQCTSPNGRATVRRVCGRCAVVRPRPRGAESMVQSHVVVTFGAAAGGPACCCVVISSLSSAAAPNAAAAARARPATASCASSAAAQRPRRNGGAASAARRGGVRRARAGHCCRGGLHDRVQADGRLARPAGARCDAAHAPRGAAAEARASHARWSLVPKCCRASRTQTDCQLPCAAAWCAARGRRGARRWFAHARRCRCTGGRRSASATPGASAAVARTA